VERVLFLCTHNSARSQIAEALLRSMGRERFEAYSAGTTPSRVHPLAVKAMQEIGIDVSAHRSKDVDEYRGMLFDYVITVCDQAREACPFFPGARRGGGRRSDATPGVPERPRRADRACS